MKKIVEDVRAHVVSECAKDTNLMDKAFYRLHLQSVEKYCVMLCSFYPADPDLMRICALIHDISAISDYASIALHHEKGSLIAAEILGSMLPRESIAKISEAIVNHNFPVNDESVESLVLSNADALSKFDAPFYWVSYGMKRRNLDYYDSLSWYLSMLSKTYDLMVPEAREIICGRYSDVRKMLSAEIRE